MGGVKTTHLKVNQNVKGYVKGTQTDIWLKKYYLILKRCLILF